jgi:hypothetical protein
MRIGTFIAKTSWIAVRVLKEQDDDELVAGKRAGQFLVYTPRDLDQVIGLSEGIFVKTSDKLIRICGFSIIYHACDQSSQCFCHSDYGNPSEQA